MFEPLISFFLLKGPLGSIINVDSISSDKAHIQGTNDAEVIRVK